MTEIAVEEQFIGAGDYYLDDVLVSPTRENNVFRVIQEKAAPRYNGIRGFLAETDYITSEMAELEVTLVELAQDKLPVMIPGAAVTAQYGDGNLTGGGGSTTLAGAHAAGVATLFLTAVTGLAIGDVVQVGPTGATREFRKLTRVGTAGASGTGTGVDVEAPMVNAHSNLEVVQEIDATTLSIDTAAGAVNLKVVSVTGLSIGDYVRIGYPGESEVRRLTFVGTSGAGGTGISFAAPLTRDHRAGDTVIEQTNEGTTLVEQAASRRLSAAAYHKHELRVPGLDGRIVRFTILKGIRTGNSEFTAADSEVPLGPRLTIQSRIDPADIEASPWQIVRGGPTS